jgi:serine/threonine-protein kinase
MSLAVGDVVGGRYRIEEKLDEGGMGAVYLARGLSEDALVIIKTLLPSWAEKPNARARFAREAEAAMSIAHPGVVRVIECDADGELPYIVMEYIRGPTLTEVVTKPPLMSVERAVALTLQLLDALSAAHALGIVHRDLKPSNVIVVDAGTPDETPKLLDFGLSRIFDDERRTKLTATGQVLGTPGFLAPEQATAGELGPWTDLWAVGVMLYVMLANRLPWQAPTAAERITAMLSDEPTRIESHRRDVPAFVAEAIHRAIARDPSVRFRSCEELIVALGGKVAIPPTAETPASHGVSRRTERSRVPLVPLALAFFAGVLVTASVGVGAYLVMDDSDTPANPSRVVGPRPTGTAVRVVRLRRFGDAFELDGIDRDDANAWVDRVIPSLEPCLTTLAVDSSLRVHITFSEEGVPLAVRVHGPIPIAHSNCIAERLRADDGGPPSGRIRFRLKPR